MTRIILAITVLLLSQIQNVRAQEWTRFRGPNGSGISDAKTVPTTWTEKDYNWVIETPGLSGSSPVIWGKKVFITSADEKEGARILFCVNAEDGAILWKQSIPLGKGKKHKNNTFASGTPCVDTDHVYVLFQSKTDSPLVAFNHQGEKVWQIDLGPYNHGQGGATSPIVYEDKVIVANDHSDGSYLIAVDRKTGETKWKIPRLGKRACYSTPCIFQPEGRSPEIIFTHCYEGMIGVDAESGVTNWHIDVFGTFEQRAVGSPQIYNDLVIGSSGFTTAEKNVVAVRPTSGKEKITVSETYRVSKTVPHIPTPLIYQDLMYLWTDTGILTCVHAKTGEKVYINRIGGTFFGSPICVNGVLYAVDRDGKVCVVQTGEEFKLIEKVSLDDECISTPAVSDGVMYLRTHQHLYSLGGK